MLERDTLAQDVRYTTEAYVLKMPPLSKVSLERLAQTGCCWHSGRELAPQGKYMRTEGPGRLAYSLQDRAPTLRRQRCLEHMIKGIIKEKRIDLHDNHFTLACVTATYI